MPRRSTIRAKRPPSQTAARAARLRELMLTMHIRDAAAVLGMSEGRAYALLHQTKPPARFPTMEERQGRALDTGRILHALRGVSHG